MSGSTGLAEGSGRSCPGWSESDSSGDDEHDAEW